MGVTVVIGGTGVGKTSFIAARIKYLLKREGKARLRQSCAEIDFYNRDRETPLTPPDRVPIYTNFDLTYQVGYKKIYKPYFIDEEYLGMPNGEKLVVPVVPYSIVGLQEMDDEYNSRKHSLAREVSAFYNKNRHFKLEIFMDLHRLMIMDSIIREVTDVFILILRQEHETNFAGKIIRTTWYCREFYDANEIGRYLDTKGAEGEYTETTYTNEGNIFRCFNSHGCAKDFIPKEGTDFIYLEQRSEVDVKTLPPEIARFYEKGAKQNGKQGRASG